MKINKKYHFIGMGGIGMSALASILLDKEMSVSGSDLSDNYIVKKLIKKGGHFTLGHRADNIVPGQTVVYCTGIKDDNPEMRAARTLNCPLLHRSELLKELMQGKTVLAVTGTHGKTTVSSLLASIFLREGGDPSFAIGGLLGGENGRFGRGKYFIAEADESDGTFLKYQPFGAIVTNIEREHMDYFGEDDRLFKAFSDFLSSVESPEHLFYCGDDPHLRNLAAGRGFSYGFSQGCDAHLSSFEQRGWRIFFDLTFEGKSYREIEVALIGKMNALNAAAAFAFSLRLGVPESIIREALAGYVGVKRRLEKKGEIHGITFLDDYAHHPTELKLTLAGLKEAIGEKRLVVLFQPHRFSRTANLLHEFAKAFESADQVFVTEIYSAEEQPMEGITAEALVDLIEKEGLVPVNYLPRAEYISKLYSFLRPHDCLITMGAGDITNFGQPLLEHCAKHPPRKFRLGLVFGGRSAEHEISLRSSRYIAESLNRDYYDVSFFGIDKQGLWLTGKEAEECLTNKKEVNSPHTESLLSEKVTSALKECDIFFPMLHGPNGEDGTIQGFFEMLGKPYVSPDFRSCAITMDKVLTKKLLIAEGVPTARYLSFTYREWLKDEENLREQMEKLTLPLFVKPVRLGSSIGVSKVEKIQDLEAALTKAFSYNDTVLVEEGVVNGRELEFAIVGNPGPITVIAPAEKCAGGALVDYNMKYSQNPVKTNIAPLIAPEILEKGKKLAKKAYQAVGLTSYCRADCILDPQGNFSFFEINAIPGFTALSLFPKMWAREGVQAPELLDRLVLLSLSRRRSMERHETMLWE